MDANPDLIDRFIDDLKPSSKRYQLALDTDFLVCVRPDGTKQWLYASPIHKNKGFARILGAFPQMKLAQAKAALAAARRTNAHEAIAPNELELLTDKQDIAPLQLAEQPTAKQPVTSPDAGQPILRADTQASHLAPMPAFNETMLATTILNTKHYFQQHRGSLIVSLLAVILLGALMIWWVFIEPAKLEKQSETASKVFAQTQKNKPANNILTPPVKTKPAAVDKTASVKPAPAKVTPVKTTPPAKTVAVKPTPAKVVSAKVPPVKATKSVVASNNHQVARLQLTSDVVDREPVDNLGQTIRLSDLPTDRITLFTDLRNLQNQQVIHRWVHNDAVVAEVPLNIGSARWRSYSNKTVHAGLTGQWRVDVVNQQNQVLRTESFRLL